MGGQRATVLLYFSRRLLGQFQSLARHEAEEAGAENNGTFARWTVDMNVEI